MATGFPVAKASNVLMTRYLGSSSSTNTPLVSWNMAFSGRLRERYIPVVSTEKYQYWWSPQAQTWWHFLLKSHTKSIKLSPRHRTKMDQVSPWTTRERGWNFLKGGFWLVCLKGKVVKVSLLWLYCQMKIWNQLEWFKYGTSIQHSTNNHIIVWVTKFGTWQREYPWVGPPIPIGFAVMATPCNWNVWDVPFHTISTAAKSGP